MTVKPICKYCGSDKGFREFGYARTSATRDLSTFTKGEDGKTKATWGFIDTDGFAEDFDADGVQCRECDREEARIEDLVGDPVMFEPGAKVVCPDGLQGVVADVDFEARRLTVENWHEEFKFSEVTPLAVAA